MARLAKGSRSGSCSGCVIGSVICDSSGGISNTVSSPFDTSAHIIGHLYFQSPTSLMFLMNLEVSALGDGFDRNGPSQKRVKTTRKTKPVQTGGTMSSHGSADGTNRTESVHGERESRLSRQTRVRSSRRND